MSQRKRKQGQMRRLRRYLMSQTGTTDPHALTQRGEELQTKIDAMTAQISKLEEGATHSDVNSDVNTDVNSDVNSDVNTAPTKSTTEDLLSTPMTHTDSNCQLVDKPLAKQQQKHLQYLLGMRQDMTESLVLNKRIQRALIG